MIKVDKPMVTDLYIPRPAGDCCITKHTFTRKDIFEILQNYISYDDARGILDEIFGEYIAGDNDLVEIILNAVGDVYTREQIDEFLERYADADWVQEWVEDKGYLTDITLTVNGEEVHNGDSITVSSDAQAFREYTAATETRIAALEAVIASLKPPVNFIYIDDFPDESYHNDEPCTEWDDETGEEIEVPCPWEGKGPYSDEWADYFYGYETMEEYLDWYMDNKIDGGCNVYSYVSDFEFGGESYWMYRHNENAETVLFGLLPKTSTKEFLISKSLRNWENIYNQYQPFAYILQADGLVYVPNEEGGGLDMSRWNLVDVE